MTLLQRWMYDHLLDVKMEKASPLYSELNSQAEEMFNKLIAQLPETLHEELTTFRDTLNGMVYLVQEVRYMQGVVSGISVVPKAMANPQGKEHALTKEVLHI